MVSEDSLSYIVRLQLKTTNKSRLKKKKTAKILAI